MNKMENKLMNYLNNIELEDNPYIDWSFFAVFSKVIEKMGGGVSCVS